MAGNLIAELQKEYGYSDYDIAKVKYVLASITSELSKLILFGIFFGITGYFSEFVSCMILLLLLRINIGGMHCKHYLSCLLLSFTISYLSIVFLPDIYTIPYFIVATFALICMLINFCIGPVASPFRPSPNSLLLKRHQNFGFIVFAIFILFASIFQNSTMINPYIQVGFWTIILHTIQLIVAKFLRIGGGHS